MNPKKIAAERAVSYVQDGMVVGLGTGSTTVLAVKALGERFQRESLKISCIATSEATAQLARSYQMPMTEWDQVRCFDISIDGADEVDPSLRLIKGGGGALVREKIVSTASDHQIIIVDGSKVVDHLGAFPLPVAVVPFGWQATRDRIETHFQRPVLRRKTPTGEGFISDDSLVILDVAFGAPLPSPDTLEAEFKTLVGVVEIGLFVGLCHRLIVGHSDGRIEEKSAVTAP